MRTNAYLRLVLILALELVVAAAARAQVSSTAYVKPTLLPSRLEKALAALGDHLDKPGKERIALGGTLQRSSGASSQVSIVWQLPSSFRLEETTSSGKRVIAFDGARVSSTSPLTDDDNGLLETLFLDSAEHFFVGRHSGLAMREMGVFRTDDGTAKTYSGPYLDIYQVADKTPAGEKRLRLYQFGMQTGLLERVDYWADPETRKTMISSAFSGWSDYQGQRVPGSITRAVGGQNVFTLTLSSASFGAALSDGSFSVSGAATAKGESQ